MKRIINFLGLIIMILVCVGCNKVNNEVINSSNIDSNNKYIEGLVIYKENDEALVVDNNQVIYRLKGLETDVDSYVKISYDGELNKNAEVQDITIKNVENVNNEFKLNSGFNNYERAKEIVEAMSLEEALGQIYMVHHSTDSLEDVRTYNLGGFIFFGADFKNKTKEDVLDMVDKLNDNSKIPLLLAVDEEGGIVTRISSNPNLASERFKSPRELYKEGGFDLIRDDTIKKNEILEGLHLNINLAPVLDISNDPKDYIYSRSVGLSPELTGVFAQTVIDASKNSKISYVMKHYPGYGKNSDTHKSKSLDTRSMEEIESDLIPFGKGIQSGGEAIMISHNIVVALDCDNPASISISNHNYLRNTLGFRGMVITDALNMGATEGIENMGIKSLVSGNDILVTKNYKEDINNILEGVSKGQVSSKYIRVLAIKVIEWKISKGLI